jgi:8-hydroxy-5-deazaflavin:NADPH oxidoreductase
MVLPTSGNARQNTNTNRPDRRFTEGIGAMSIAVIGTGRMGSTLGRALREAGFEVVYGSRDPEAAALTADPGAKAVTVQEALAGAQTVLLAVPGTEVEPFLAAHGPALDGVLLVDATNKITESVLHSADETERHAPGARYARAFNTLGVENLEVPEYGGIQGDMFFSSALQDEETVAQLIAAVGVRPVYLGPGQWGLLDDVVRLWYTLTQLDQRGRRVGFKVLTD